MGARRRRRTSVLAALLAAGCLLGTAASCGGDAGGAGGAESGAEESQTQPEESATSPQGTPAAQAASGTGADPETESATSPQEPPAAPPAAAPENPDGTPAEEQSETGTSRPPVQLMLEGSGVRADVNVPPELEMIPPNEPAATDEPPPRPFGVRGPLEDSTSAEDVPSALADQFWPGFPTLVDPGLIRSGGPPPDGIRPVDSPTFNQAANVDYLEDAEAVLSLEINGDARAYPLRMMTVHELVNDRVGGIPVTVSYCPLCNSGVAYDRRVGERVLDFGTSGRLYQSSLVMYDRQTQSLWTHFDGTAVVGELAGIRLHFYPVAVVAWSDWLEAYPEGRVLAPVAGRNYGRNPYAGYEESPGLLSTLFQSEPFDERLPPKDRVIGIRSPSSRDAAAVRHECLRREGVISADLDGRALVVWNLPGANSAIDTAMVSVGRDVGSTGVFEAETETHGLLTFTRTEEGFRDAETGSDWNLFGVSVGGPLQGNRLQPLEFLDTFWFAWSTFEENTRIVPPPDEEC